MLLGQVCFKLCLYSSCPILSPASGILTMEDVAPSSEASVRRSKRARVTRFNIGGTVTSAGLKELGEQSPNQPDHDDSMDDFDEIRPKVKRGRAAEPSNAQIGDQSLIEVIKSTRKLIPVAVKLWVERYEKDPKPAIADLLTMTFEACGVKYQTVGDFEEADVDEVVVHLVNLARNGEVDDYQSSKRKSFNHFKDNLVYFWDSLAIECQNGPLLDGVVFEKCMDYVIALSTPPRFYRQVASTIGLQLLTSFTTIAKMLGSQRETTQRQLNAEKKKHADGPRVESLNKRLSETHEKITIVEKMMRKIFHGLFVHRYRDIDPNIRTSCIQSLGGWILAYPSMFLQDLYLKYLGWTLNDKTAGVRKASVIALQNLYEIDDNVPSLGLFTERFANRMIELADDVDISVAVSAIGLVRQLLRHQLLSDDDLGPLYDLLIDEPPEIRHAIGELVYDHLIAQKSASNASSKGMDEDSSLVTLSRMLQILREFSTDPILISYVIDDVWEFMKAMKDWKSIISILLDETPSIELTENDATNLIRLLSASVRKAVGERIAPAVDNRKLHFTKAQKEVFENNKQTMTLTMMKNYPVLLRKYMADQAKVPSLVEIIRNMNLELYSLKRQEQNFKAVFELLKAAYFRHGDKESLRSCVQAINFCITESKGELQDFALDKLKGLEDELLLKLKSAIKEAVEGDDDYPLLVNLKRLYELQLSKFVPIDGLFSDFANMIADFRSTNEEVVSFLLLNMYLHLSWSLCSIVNSDAVSIKSLSSLCSKRDILFKHLGDFLNSSYSEGEVTIGNHLSCRVCLMLADMWCLFREANFSSTKSKSLGFAPDQSAIEQFWQLCEQQLGISHENDEGDVSKEYVELTIPDSILIAAGKLITTDTVPMGYLGPEVISRFIMHGTSAAEIVKQLISVLRNKVDIPDLFIAALKRAYHRHQIEVTTGDEESAKRTLLDCKDLSVRLCGTFMGYGRSKHTPEMLKIVKNGIEYAFTDMPNHLSFLECGVLHFVSKLPAADVLDILKDVQRRTEKINTDEEPSSWCPYFTFVEVLQEKYVKNEGFAEEKEGTSVRRRGRPRKVRNVREGKKLFDEQSSSEEEDAISSSDQEAPDDRSKQDEDEDDEEDAPLIRSTKSSAKLRALKALRKSQTRPEEQAVSTTPGRE
ncbi:hypothetical protein V2J09_016666 [Rumex salicifolius]